VDCPGYELSGVTRLWLQLEVRQIDRRSRVQFVSLLRLSCDRSIPVTFVDFEYGRLLACMGDKEGVRVQLDLLLSGKPLEVNATGRKVRAVYSSRPRQRYADHLMDTPCTGQVQSLEVCRRIRYPRYRLSCLLSFFFFFSRTNCTCVPAQRSKRFNSISVSRYCIFLHDLYSLRVVITLLTGQLPYSIVTHLA
jgi:hypothetical protein